MINDAAEEADYYVLVDSLSPHSSVDEHAGREAFFRLSGTESGRSKIARLERIIDRWWNTEIYEHPFPRKKEEVEDDV